MVHQNLESVDFETPDYMLDSLFPRELGAPFGIMVKINSIKGKKDEFAYALKLAVPENNSEEEGEKKKKKVIKFMLML